MTTENKPRTLEELIAKHHGETVEFSNAELIASLIAWHKAALERYGANGIYVHGERRGACFANGIRVLIEKEKE